MNTFKYPFAHYSFVLTSCFICFLVLLTGCGQSNSPTTSFITPIAFPENGPPAGWEEGNCPVPLDGHPIEIQNPQHIIGNGTAQSCSAEAFIQAVELGGSIVFDCGDLPHTITLPRTARIFNNGNPDVVIDGNGLITLSGGGKNRILYMNACDSDLVWTTPHCDNQDHPRLTLQNITLSDGNSRGASPDGGGALWARGGRLRLINTRFFNNTTDSLGPDVGGGAVRVFDQYQKRPVLVVNSTFGGAEGFGNWGANGGALSSIGVSWSIYNSLFSHNRAVGNGANPARAGTPGGGSGGAIYNDGNTMTLFMCGVHITENIVQAHGSAIFFVTNDYSGNMEIRSSRISGNHGGSWHILPGISMHPETRRLVIESVIE